MRKALLTVLVPFGLVAGGALGYHYWDTGALPGMHPTFHPVSVDTINAEDRGVRITGTAHYEIQLHQTFEGGERWHIFPFMAPGDTMNREVKVLVRAQRDPEALVTYEDMVVDGLARPAGGRVGPKVIDALRNQGYTFAKGLILVEAMAVHGPGPAE